MTYGASTGHLFSEALRRIPDTDDNGAGQLCVVDQPSQSFVAAPIDGAKRERRINDVLPVVHVDDREGAVGVACYADGHQMSTLRGVT